MDKKLLDSEWIILRALWGKEPQAMKDIIASVKKEQPRINWSYKTYHSYLRILLQKGLIGCNVLSARDKLYYANITYEEALDCESDSLVSRINKGSLGHLVAMMAEKGQLSSVDKDELIALIHRFEKEGGGDNG